MISVALVTSSSAVLSRTHSLVFLCASLLGSSSTSQLCLAPCHDPRRLPCPGDSSSSPSSSFASSSWFTCSCTSGAARGSAASSVVVDLGFCGVSVTDLRFSSDQLCSASRRTLRACTTPSSVRTRCSSVRSLFPQPHARFPSANFGTGISRSRSNLWKMCKNCFSKLHQFSSRRSAHGTIERRLHITTSETRNEPSCMSNNPSHQGAVGSWSVTCALLLAANIVRTCPCSCF